MPLSGVVVAEPLVIHDSLILFLAAWYRAALQSRPEAVCQNVEVGQAEPSTGTFPRRMLVISNDGGVGTSFLTGERSVRLVVLAGSHLAPQEANDLIAIVHALTSQIAAPGFDVQIGGVAYKNPVTGVVDVNGPFDADEAQNRARRFISVTLAVSGRPL